jgi:Flp pilus assembly protein TadG
MNILTLKPTAYGRARGKQKGVAAIELVALLPILLAFLLLPYFYARYMWHYTAAQKAAQDATRYLSSISVTEMRTAALARAASAIASQIATTEMQELSPAPTSADVAVFCGSVPCVGVGSRPLPETVRVWIALNMSDDLFGAVDTGQYGMPLTVDVTVRYVGN